MHAPVVDDGKETSVTDKKELEVNDMKTSILLHKKDIITNIFEV